MQYSNMKSLRVGDTLYFAPNGVGEDGVMDLHLSDFAIGDPLLHHLAEYSHDPSRLNEKYGAAMILEGIANSMKLILEAQEQNETRLPSNELRVIFTDGGEHYTLQPSDTFQIDNSYFSIGLMCYEYCSGAIEHFRYDDDDIQNAIDWIFIGLNDVKDHAYTNGAKTEAS